MSDAVLGCSGLHKTFTSGPSPVTVLRGVDLRVAPGERVAADLTGNAALLHPLLGVAHHRGLVNGLEFHFRLLRIGLRSALSYLERTSCPRDPLDAYQVFHCACYDSDSVRSFKKNERPDTVSLQAIG